MFRPSTKMAAVAAAALMVGVGLLSAAPATATTTTRIVPVVGTGHYLVYGKYTPVASGKATVNLYSLGSDGHTRALGSIKTITPESIPATASGTVLVAPKDGVENYRWDLTTGARTTIAEQTVAAPDGYAEIGSNGKTGVDSRSAVVLVTAAGSTIIGVPFPRGENVDGSIGLQSGSAGVTITDNNGHIRYIAFANPGVVRSLHTYNEGANDASVGCAAFTSVSVACSGFDEDRVTLMGVQLDGTKFSHTTVHCVNTPAALHTAIAWVGCKNRLEVLHSDNSVTTSTTTFGTAKPVSAFGKVVLQSNTGTSLQTMTRAGSKPATVVPAG